MYAYNLLLTQNERKLQLDTAEDESESSCAEILAKSADVIADGMAILTAVRNAPKRLISEGERLEETTRNAPGDEPPRNLWQSVRNWTENVIKAVRAKGSRRSQTSNIEQRLTRLEQRVDALAEEMRAGFERVHGEIGRLSGEVGGLNGEVGRLSGEVGELQRNQREGMRETRANFRGLRGLTYGPVLERWVMRSLPTYLLNRCSPLLRAGQLQIRVLHHDHADWNLSQAFPSTFSVTAHKL